MKDSFLPFVFRKQSLAFQIIVALILVPIQMYIAYLFSGVLKLPLFMDMIFLYATAFLGAVCGVVFSFGISIFAIYFNNSDWGNFLFIICYLTGVAIVRYVVYKNKEVGIIQLVLITLFSALLTSIEGGLIYSIAYAQIGEKEIDAVRYLTYSFVAQHIPIYLSAIFSRIPINLIDKTIAVFVGFFSAVVLEKICGKKSKSVV